MSDSDNITLPVPVIVTREDFLEAADDVNGDRFIALLCRHHLKDDSFDVDELLATLSRKQLDELWNSLQQKCASALLNFDNIGEEDPLSSSNPESPVAMLQSIITVAGSTVALENADVPQGLFETAAILHGILLSLPEGNERLANSISCLCETWWLRELDGRDELVSQTLVHLLKRCMEPNITNADIKRLWRIHAAVSIIDLSDERSVPLTMLFQQAVASAPLLKSPEGRKFLAFLFTLKEETVDGLHSAMKTVIAESNKTAMDWIGEVYFRAWTDATGSVQTTIEKTCIQDLMYCAMLAEKTAAPLLHRMLAYFHKQKKQKGVDDMLLRLYNPILWRSLKVANSAVRANAVSLLFDAFPLQNPMYGVEETEELLRKQYNAFEEMLMDPSHAVRVVVVSGICRVSAIYWEFIPPEKIRTLISTIVQKLAWDASSADVRHAVVKGFTFMVDYPLTHSLLNSVLPKLCNLFHDKTEKVRLAVAELLLKVKQLRAIKFWTLVPVEHILARLEIESPTVAKRLVDLLFNSYFPDSKPLDVQFSRAVQLIKSNPGAARKFYLYAYNFANTMSSAKFIVYVLTCLAEVATRNEAQNNTTRTEDSSVVRSEEEPESDVLEMSDKNANTEDENGTNASNSISDMDITVSDIDLISGLLDSVVILWTGIQPNLNKSSAVDVRKAFELRVARYLPIILRNFEDARIVEPLMMMASSLQPNAVPTVSCSVLSKLRALAQSSSDNVDYGPLVLTMCKWKKGNQILELISDWIEPCLLPAPASNQRRGSQGRTVTFSEKARPYPLQGVRYLDYILVHMPCRVVLLENNRPALRSLADSLKNITKLMEQRATSGTPLDQPMTDDVLMKIFEMYLRLEVLLNQSDKPHDSAVAALEHQLTWIDSQLVPRISATTRKLPQRKRVRRLLTANDCTLMSDTMNETLVQSVLMSDTSTVAPAEPSVETKTFIKNVIERVLVIATDMLLIGIADHELISRLGDFCISLLRLDDGVSFLGTILSLMYRMAALHVDGNSGSVLDEDEGVASGDNPLPRLMVEVINILSTVSQTKKSVADKLLSDLRHPLTEAFTLFISCSESQPGSVMDDVISAATAVIMTDMVNAIQQDCNFAPCSSVQELPRLSSLIVSLLIKKKSTTAMFVPELELVCQSEVCNNVKGLLACLHVINAVSTGKTNGISLKQCLVELRRRLENITVPDAEPDDSECRLLFKSGEDLLNSCCNRLGFHD